MYLGAAFPRARHLIGVVELVWAVGKPGWF